MPPRNERNGKSVKKAEASFQDFFGTLYGSRWATLRAAMAKPSTKVALWNRFCKLKEDETAASVALAPLAGATLRVYMPHKASAQDTTDEAAQPQPVDSVLDAIIEKPPVDENRTPAYYLLDLASTLIVEQLAVEGHHKVLDLCAAPGGKSIAIAQSLALVGGELTSNEPNRERCARLKRNLAEFLPLNSIVSHVTQRDATLWHQPNVFDRVLVDAPCSSERHLLQQPLAALGQWSPRYTADMAVVQTKLLLRALEAVKLGGRVVYSTCSISDAENDGVVRGVLQKTRCGIQVVPTKLRMGEPTEFGWIVLPDVAEGWGPMFCCTFEKTAIHRPYSEDDEDDDDEDSEETSGDE